MGKPLVREPELQFQFRLPTQCAASEKVMAQRPRQFPLGPWSPGKASSSVLNVPEALLGPESLLSLLPPRNF